MHIFLAVARDYISETTVASYCDETTAGLETPGSLASDEVFKV